MSARRPWFPFLQVNFRIVWLSNSRWISIQFCIEQLALPLVIPLPISLIQMTEIAAVVLLVLLKGPKSSFSQDEWSLRYYVFQSYHDLRARSFPISFLHDRILGDKALLLTYKLRSQRRLQSICHSLSTYQFDWIHLVLHPDWCSRLKGLIFQTLSFDDFWCHCFLW